MKIADLRPIVLCMCTVWVEETQRYLTGWSDQRVAEVVGVHALAVGRVRLEAFGSGDAATELWRLRWAIMLTAQHFDHTTAGGRWDRGWDDDRVAELAGVEPGLIRKIREATPIPAADELAEARRQRYLIRNGTATRAARVLRLADEVDPLTRRPYTARGILQTLIEVGEMDPASPAAEAAAVDWIADTITVGRARLDPATGLERPAGAIARATGIKTTTVRRILARYSGERAADEGRPSKLSAVVCRRVEQAARSPHRFDRRTSTKWLTEWIWLTDKGRPSKRTLLGWRRVGAVDLAAGRDTLPARLERAIVALVDLAGPAPVLPTAPELARFAGRPATEAAEALGCTVEQIRRARKDTA